MVINVTKINSYRVNVNICGVSEGKQLEDIEIALMQMPHTDYVATYHPDEKCGSNINFVITGESGEEDDLADKLMEKVWDVAGEYKEIEINMKNLDECPTDTYHSKKFHYDWIHRQPKEIKQAKKSQ
jgi:hypothetical protein